jgi:hypothetical protein
MLKVVFADLPLATTVRASEFCVRPNTLLHDSEGYLTVNFQESWDDDSGHPTNGHRIRFIFIYKAPLNGIAFWETSPHKRHHANGAQQTMTSPSKEATLLNALCFT